MELGEKLRVARLEAGLSQRELCGEEITRNMLSRIEHGAARPSMDTLRYLAGKLGKPMSFFLEETAVCSPNQQVMASARQAFDRGDFNGVIRALEDYRSPDETFDRERRLLEVLSRMELAEQAAAQGREPYARELLETVGALGKDMSYYTEDLERRRLLLLRRAGEKAALPSLDEELLLRAEDALLAGNLERAARLLDAAEDQTSARWNMLRGEASMGRKEYAKAAQCLHLAEDAYPKETAEKLEECYRELGDFQKAYFYACLRRQGK